MILIQVSSRARFNFYPSLTCSSQHVSGKPAQRLHNADRLQAEARDLSPGKSEEIKGTHATQISDHRHLQSNLRACSHSGPEPDLEVGQPDL